MYRWYGLEAFQTMVKNDQIEEEPLFLAEIAGKNENSGFLMRFYEVLFETLLFQLEIVASVLELQKNPLDLLFEYNTKVSMNNFGFFSKIFKSLNVFLVEHLCSVVVGIRECFRLVCWVI